MKNESNPQHPQQLRCLKKMKTLASESLLMLQLFECRESGGQCITAEGRNYSNAGLSIKPCGPALCNVTSHSMRMFKGEEK